MAQINTGEEETGIEIEIETAMPTTNIAAVVVVIEIGIDLPRNAAAVANGITDVIEIE